MSLGNFSIPTRILCLELLKRSPSTHNHKSFVKLYKYLHCNHRSFSTTTTMLISRMHILRFVASAATTARSILRLPTPNGFSCGLGDCAKQNLLPQNNHHGVLGPTPAYLPSRGYPTLAKHDEDPASPNNQGFRDYLRHLVDEYEDILVNLETGTGLMEKEMKQLRHRELIMRHVVEQIKQLDRKKAEVKEIEALMKGGESNEGQEMKALAEEEMEKCRQAIQELEQEIVSLLTPPEQTDENDILIELFAGVGGQEAMLFTAEMFDMYRQYAAYKGWRFRVIEYATTELVLTVWSNFMDNHHKERQIIENEPARVLRHDNIGTPVDKMVEYLNWVKQNSRWDHQLLIIHVTCGARHAVASISGSQVNRFMKYEGGVHRVQRVPKTEKSGRIHTSTMTVAILPQPKEIDLKIEKKDVRIETKKASGAGGQHVNTTDSAVRLVHIPTGLAVECQQERSQIKNRQIAMQVLYTRIYNQILDRHLKAERSLRRDQVGLAGRSEKIRTYNFNQDRITDHRAGQSVFSIDSFLTGEEQLDDLIQSLIELDMQQRLRNVIKDFVETQSGVSTSLR